MFSIGVSLGARLHGSKYRIPVAIGIIVVLVAFFATVIGIGLHADAEAERREEEERMKRIRTFSSCQDAGYPVEDDVCTLPDGRAFEKFRVRVRVPE